TLREAREKPKTQQKRVWDPETKSLKQARDDDGKLVYYEDTERTIDDVWRLPYLMPADKTEKLDYPTQKPEKVIQRIIGSSTSEGDLILDCFIGSGTAAAVAQKLGRRWVGCDINKGAIQTTAKRLQLVMAEQAGKNGPAQGKLLSEGDAPLPAQLGFTHWRVNDYDLAIQHNEAVNLACEYLGVERLRNDPYFDGLLGKRLVKIIPFGHPLSPMDLEAIKNELDARPDEDRAITVVCLGKELASDTWLTEWNRLRKKKTDPHHIEVIELRNDPKYGGFIQHEQAQARVAVKRKADKLHVEIMDFVSPSILQRLAQQSGVVQAKVADWRAMVDSVMIDTAYDGAVFNVTLADVPARKTDFVAGDYVLDAPAGDTTVAVKITDMLGEELLLPTVV
ncbi:site-specific DNA-methyltransferase, partial [Ottowia sp.]|uniref:site-specific DNA-methyltransferase n=1 Tax=Ottowia sp. TaxID=1898956 RepID=UPI002BC2EABB